MRGARLDRGVALLVLGLVACFAGRRPGASPAAPDPDPSSQPILAGMSMDDLYEANAFYTGMDPASRAGAVGEDLRLVREEIVAREMRVFEVTS
jgi:hypothetical protein